MVTAAAVRPDLAGAAADTEEQLAAAAPHLVDGYRAALPAAADLVGRRLRGALFRENVLPVRKGPGRLHAFNRYEFASAGTGDPATLLPRDGGDGLAAEVTNATVNLAVAYARRAAVDARLRSRARATGAADLLGTLAGIAPDEQALVLEQLATEGHNLHPCGRTRLGWRVPDLLHHDLEADATRVEFVAVRRTCSSATTSPANSRTRTPSCHRPPGYVLHPVHPWQLDRVVRSRYADLLRAGAMHPLEAACRRRPPPRCAPCCCRRPRRAALPQAVPGHPGHLDPAQHLGGEHPQRPGRVGGCWTGCSPTRTGCCCCPRPPARPYRSAPAGSGTWPRSSAAGLDGRLRAGEVPVPGGALPARSPITGRPSWPRWSTGTRPPGSPTAAGPPWPSCTSTPGCCCRRCCGWPPATASGWRRTCRTACPTFVGGRPHRMALRDFAGMRLHPPRLAAAGSTCSCGRAR